ncbi:MAG: HD domain-containing protein [Verrucomicrobiota bacterium]|nr:HD domain-containing protein [Verrucomicrobiota bacterium]
MENELNRIWDPMYGLMELSPLESSFVFCPEVQRLRHIRLCNIDSLLIPGAAQVSRFEHALGTLRLANEWLAAKNKVAFGQADNLRIAALVHDTQSGPFGHSIQYILEDNKIGGDFKHEDLSGAREKMYHQDLSANASYLGAPFLVEKLCDKRWKHVSEMINGRGPLGKLVSGDIDLDNIDNVVRLAFHVGICNQEDKTLPIQLARSISLSKTGIQISVKNIPLVTRWQEIRKRLYEFLLLDWGEFSGKAMLTRAFEDAAMQKRVGIDNWRLTDEELIQMFLGQIGDSQSIKIITSRLRLGQLYTPIMIARSPSVESYKFLNLIATKREIEKQIRKAVYKDRPGPQILVHFILDVKKTDRSVKITCKETQKQEVIGFDSRCLLIGVFASKPVKSKESLILKNESIRILSENGCKDIKMVSDPLILPRAENDQLALLS